MYKRLFIAIKINPTEELLRRIYFFKSNLKHESINWIRDDHYHLTLKFLGKVPVDRIEQMSEEIRGLTVKTEKFMIRLTKLGVFGTNYKPRVLWIGINEQEKIMKLHHEIETGLNRIGFVNNGQNFVPHISLARLRKLADKAFFQSLISKFDLEIIHEQMLEEIILFESILGPKGAEYNVIERFKLGGV